MSGVAPSGLITGNRRPTLTYGRSFSNPGTLDIDWYLYRGAARTQYGNSWRTTVDTPMTYAEFSTVPPFDLPNDSNWYWKVVLIRPSSPPIDDSSTTGTNFQLDYSAPTAPTPTGPANGGFFNTVSSMTFNWNFNDADAGDDQSAFYIETSTNNFASAEFNTGWITSSAKTYTWTGSWPQGIHYWRVYTKDLFGLQSTVSPTWSFTMDSVAPTIGGVTGTTYTNAATQRMSVTGTSGGTTAVSHVDAYILNYAGTTWSGAFAAVNDGGGTWHYDFNAAYEAGNGDHLIRFWVYDAAGNGSSIDSHVVYDTVLPANANSVKGRIGTVTLDISWSAFSDPAPSSGYLRTVIHVQSWNGSTWVDFVPPGLVVELGGNYTLPAGTTYTLTGLTQGTKYQFLVAHKDKAGNYSSVAYVPFTTKKRIGTYRMKKGDGTVIDLPVYDLSPMIDNGAITAFRVKVPNGVGCFEIVPTTDQKASPFRILYQGVTKSISLP